MALSKQKEKKKLLQLVCGNGIAEIEGKKKIVAMALLKQEEKKLLQLVCDNGIAEIEGKKEKKNYGNWFVAMAQLKQEGKKNYCYWFVAMTLLKQKGKKIVAMDLWQQYCQNRKEKKKFVAIDLPKIGGERELFE